MDGFQDARDAFDEVSITTVKPPKNLDFSFQDEWRISKTGRSSTMAPQGKSANHSLGM
jgi:predicted dinucleotide-utilizing enzyme